MKRTTESKSITANAEIQDLASALVARMSLASSLGQQTYGGDRDIYQALGYPTTIKYNDYVARYFRQDIAKAIIDRPVKSTWQGKLELVEDENEDTPFELAWTDLNDRFGMQQMFSRVDRLAGIGRYGVLLLGLDDVKINEDFQKPVASGKRKLIYMMPFGEGSAMINTYENDPTNPRYGKPLTYNVTVQQLEGGVSMTIMVHYTRILHIIENPLESEVESTPILEIVFNRLIDLEKLIGGDAEMYWRGARPGYAGIVDKDFQLTPQTKTDLKDQIDEYEHNLRRILVNEGVDLKALAQQIADPKNHVEVQLMMISAVTGIPKRILVGSERGELSSAQDSGEWKTFIQIRRTDHAEPHIIRVCVKRFQELGILPQTSTGKYSITWEDLFALSEGDRVKIGLDRSTAIKNYTASPLSASIMPEEAFAEFCLGLNSDQINRLNQLISKSGVSEDMSILKAAQEAALANPAKPPVKAPASNPAKKDSTIANPQPTLIRNV
jgi:hypothetical protein